MRLMTIARTATVVAAISIAVSACVRREGPSGDQHPLSHDVAGPAEMVEGESIFGLDLALIDQEGTALQLADLRGHVMLAAMVYTSCTSVCIMVTEQMKAIEHQLTGVDRDVTYVLFSLDPGRDTPEAMRAFLREHRLETTRWRLMAASEEGVRDLAAVLGVRYQPEENGEIAHSAMIFVIDEDGVVRHRQVGVGKDSSELVAAVRRARD
jgi:protein SCO1/2